MFQLLNEHTAIKGTLSPVEKWFKCPPNKSQWIIFSCMWSQLHNFFSIFKSVGGASRRRLWFQFQTCAQLTSSEEPTPITQFLFMFLNIWKPKALQKRVLFLHTKSQGQLMLPKASVELMQCLVFQFHGQRFLFFPSIEVLFLELAS